MEAMEWAQVKNTSGRDITNEFGQENLSGWPSLLIARYSNKRHARELSYNVYLILLHLLYEHRILLRSTRSNLHLITNIPNLIYTLMSCISYY